MTNKRIAVVTGARQGIGLEASKAVLQDGHVVVMMDRHSFDAPALVGPAHAGNVLAQTVDVTDDDAVERVKKTIQESRITVESKTV